LSYWNKQLGKSWQNLPDKHSQQQQPAGQSRHRTLASCSVGNWEREKLELLGWVMQYSEDEGEKSIGKQVSLAPLATEKAIFILGQPSWCKSN